MNKKWIVWLTPVLLMALLLSACGKKSEPAPTEATAVVGMPNPVHQTDEAGLVQATGISLPAPEGAEDARWSYIDSGKGNPVAQLDFRADGKEVCLRAQATGELEIGDISGLHYTWSENADAEVQGRAAKLFLSGEIGYIAWLDTVPGILYNLSMTEGASAETLTTLANSAFVPLQGDA